MLKKKLGVGVQPVKRLLLKIDDNPYYNRAGFALLLWVNSTRFALRQGGVNVDDVMWYNIKIMVFFIVPLGNLMALLLWRRRCFYEYKDYPGEGRVDVDYRYARADGVQHGSC